MSELLKLTDNRLPFADYIGVEYVSASKDQVVAKLNVTADLCTVPAVMHGGAIMAFADTIGAAGAILNLPEGSWTTTIESKTNFVSPAPVDTTVTAEATPVHRGGKTMIWQTRLTSEAGKLIAVVTQTQMVLDK